MRNLSPHNYGLICAILNMLVYGLTPVGAKYFMTGYDPLLFAGIASFIGAWPFIALMPAEARSGVYSGRFLRPLLIIALLSGLANGLLFVGISLTSAINAGLLEQIEPVYSICLAAIFLGERITARQGLATTVMILGAVVLAYRGYDGFNPGDLMILFAPLLFQLSHLFAKKILHQVGHIFVVPAARLLYGGIGMCLVALAINPGAAATAATPNYFLAVIAFALIFRSLDLWLWYSALRNIPLSLASSLLPIAAGVSFIAAIVLWGEAAHLQQFIGLALILFGLVILVFPKRIEAHSG